MSSPLRRLVTTASDPALAVVRVALGAVMFAHAAQKVFGWYGGPGLAGTMGFFTGPLGLPAPVAAFAIAAEFLGSLGLLAGLFGRVAALGIVGVMAGAALMVHANVGFFMNWMGQQAGEGYEYHLLALAMGAAVALRGSGALSLDRLIAARLARPDAEAA